MLSLLRAYYYDSNQRKIWSLVSLLKAKNTLEELDVLRFFEFKVEEFPYKTFFYDYDDLKAINKSGYTEHYLGKSLTVRPLVIAKCILLNVFFVWVKSFFKAINGIWRKTRYYLIPPKHLFTQYIIHFRLISKNQTNRQMCH